MDRKKFWIVIVFGTGFLLSYLYRETMQSSEAVSVSVSIDEANSFIHYGTITEVDSESWFGNDAKYQYTIGGEIYDGDFGSHNVPCGPYKSNKDIREFLIGSEVQIRVNAKDYSVSEFALIDNDGVTSEVEARQYQYIACRQLPMISGNIK